MGSNSNLGKQCSEIGRGIGKLGLILKINAHSFVLSGVESGVRYFMREEIAIKLVIGVESLATASIASSPTTLVAIQQSVSQLTAKWQDCTTIFKQKAKEVGVAVYDLGTTRWTGEEESNILVAWEAFVLSLIHLCWLLELPVDIMPVFGEMVSTPSCYCNNQY